MFYWNDTELSRRKKNLINDIERDPLVSEKIIATTLNVRYVQAFTNEKNRNDPNRLRYALPITERIFLVMS